jgi:hypothetical protein
MNDPSESDLKDLEAELSALRPSPLPSAMRTRVAIAFQAPQKTKGLSWRLGWPALGAMAAVALIAAVSMHSPRKQAQAPAEFEPVSAEEVVTAVRDDGDVVLGDGTPARQLDTSVVQTVVWKDPASNATLSWSAPREEIRIVPVSYH